MTTMPQAMPRALLGALRQASHTHRLRHAPGNAWRNARRYARTYERTYLRTLFKPWVDLSRNVSRAKCATIHPCPGAEATLRTRLTDRHRPCRQAVDELSALVTAERDRQRAAHRQLARIATYAEGRGDEQAARRIMALAADLDGPAESNTENDRRRTEDDDLTRYLREQLAAESERLRRARMHLGNILDQMQTGPVPQNDLFISILATLAGLTGPPSSWPNDPLPPPNLSTPQATTNPSAGRHG